MTAASKAAKEARDSSDKAQHILNKAGRQARLALKQETGRPEAKPQQSDADSAHSPVLIFLILVSVNLMLIFDRLILRMHRKQMKTQKCIQDPKQRKESRDTKHSRRRRCKSP
jgi:hypothetical protein